MGQSFVKLHFDHLQDLEGYWPAEILYEYLCYRNASPYTKKDADGFFTCSAQEIAAKLKFKRTVMTRARDVLVRHELIEYRTTLQRAPVVCYKILK